MEDTKMEINVETFTRVLNIINYYGSLLTTNTKENLLNNINIINPEKLSYFEDLLKCIDLSSTSDDQAIINYVNQLKNKIEVLASQLQRREQNYES